MTDPETNLELLGQCISRISVAELTLRSIIDNTRFSNSSIKALANDRLRNVSESTSLLLKLLNDQNTKA
jgi:hypothetical protein